MTNTNREAIVRLQHQLWEVLCLATGSSGEQQTAGLIRIRAELAKELKLPDPTMPQEKQKP